MNDPGVAAGQGLETMPAEEEMTTNVVSKSHDLANGTHVEATVNPPPREPEGRKGVPITLQEACEIARSVQADAIRREREDWEREFRFLRGSSDEETPES